MAPPIVEITKKEVAESFKQAEDRQGLLNWCLLWTQGEPDNFEAWRYLGDAYVCLGREREAIKA